MNSSALRKPQSVLLTVVAWTLTSTSSASGIGRSTSSIRRTSGGPYRSQTTALMSSLRVSSARGCRIGPPCFHTRPARKSSAGLPPDEPGRARRPVGITQPASETRLRRKFALSRWTPQTASYTARSSASVNVGPTNAVAMPLTSRSTRTRSTASRTIRTWSNASSSLPSSDVGHRHEGGGGGIRAGDDAAHVAEHGEVRDRDDVHPRVAPGIAVGAELGQQARGVDAGLLGQLSLRRLVQRLVGALEAAGDRPHPLERRHAAADEQDVQPAAGHGQDDHVDRDGERRELRRVVVRRHSRVRCFWSSRLLPYQ